MEPLGSARVAQEENIPAGCSKSPSARPQPMKAPEASLFSPTHPKLPRQLVLRVGYVEDAFEPRTKHGKRRVSARRGWAGEKSGFLSILLCGKELFGIGRRKPTELSAVVGAVQNRHLQALQ